MKNRKYVQNKVLNKSKRPADAGPYSRYNGSEIEDTKENVRFATRDEG